jgi:hypothetical protein
MYYASTRIRTSKKKVPCTLVTTDGERYQGSFFCSGDQRIKDLLNDDKQFVAFEATGGEIYLINRNCVARVMPNTEKKVVMHNAAGSESGDTDTGFGLTPG